MVRGHDSIEELCQLGLDRRNRRIERTDFIDFFSSDFSVGALEGVTVDLQGLGLLNWVVKKVILGVVQQSISTILMTSGKELLRKEFSEVSLVDEMYTTFKIL